MPQPIDLTGQTFHEWTVIDRAEVSGLWNCRCSCGVVKAVKSHSLRNGVSRECGHSNAKHDLTGQKFGRWTVESRAPQRGSSRGRRWNVRCECGNTSDVLAQTLLNGDSVSCGCITKELVSEGKYGTGRRADLEGATFGILEFVRYSDVAANSIWKCGCGKVAEYRTSPITRGKRTSCGCLRAAITKARMAVKFKDTKRTCRRCKTEKHITSFNHNPAGQRKHYCSSCETAADQLRQQQRDEYDARQAAEREALLSAIPARADGIKPPWAR